MVAANLIFSKQMRQESILICLEKAAIATRLAPIVKFTLQQSPQTSWLAARIQYVEARNIWGYPRTLPLHGILSLDHAQICVSSFTPCILDVTKIMMAIYPVSPPKKNLTMLLNASNYVKLLPQWTMVVGVQIALFRSAGRCVASLHVQLDNVPREEELVVNTDVSTSTLHKII